MPVKRKMKIKAVQYENLHIDFINGIFVSHVLDQNNIKYLYSENLTETWVNFASVLEIDKVNLNTCIDTIIDFYSSRNRRPSVFLLKDKTLDHLISNLEQQGFTLNYSDSLMTFEKNDSKLSIDGYIVKKVENPEEMSLFIDLFYKAHTGGEGEIYGEAAKEYRDCFMKAYLHPQSEIRREYYIGYLNNHPTTYGCIFIKDSVAGLYAIGSIPEYRKKGLAKALSLYMVERSKQMGAGDIFLLTETNSINEAIYTKMGFKTKFIYSGYSK